MVQHADLRDFYDSSGCCGLNQSTDRRVLAQREVCPGVFVGVEVGLEDSPQTGLVHNNHVIQTLSTNRSDQPLDVGVLPGRLRGRENFPNAEPLRGFVESLSVASIPIPQQLTWRAVPRERFQ
jgi:hypothetical protein